MKTSTSPYGRDVHLHGYPLKIADIAAQLEGTAYVTRQSVETVPAIRKAKKAIRKAFENSMAGKGLQPRRNRLHLQLRLEDVSGEIKQMDAGEHVPLLSAG